MKLQIYTLTAFALSLAACGTSGIKGNGIYQEKQYNISDFSKIEVKNNFEVIVTQEQSYSVRIKAEENIMPTISVKKQGDNLELKYRSDLILKPNAKVSVFVSAPMFKKIDLSGASSVKGASIITGNSLNIEASGASKINIEVNVQDLSVDGSGATEFNLRGNAVNLDAEGSGSTDINAFDLITETAAFDLSGASKVDITAHKTLKVDASGASKIRYKGNPSISQDVSGASIVKAVQ